MYTFLIQNDNSVIATERQRIMQCSKLVDMLQIIVPKFYNGLEMANYSARLEYLTPINHKYNYVELEIADANYKTDYLLYRIPIDINLTSEVGDVEFMVTFIEVTMTEDGVVNTPVRKTDAFTMPIIPIARWFTDISDGLDTMDQRIIAMMEMQNAMMDTQKIIQANKLDDIKLDTDTNMIYGTSGGAKQGKGIKLQDLGDAIADNTADGMVYVNTFDDEEGDG